MRILQVAKSSLPPGGQGHTVHHLSDTLGRRGHDVTVLALHPHPRDRTSLLSDVPGADRAYRIERVRLPRTRGLLHNLIFARAIGRLARRGRFDLVHAHMLYPEGECALRGLRGLAIPLVVTGHGEDIQVDAACGYGVRRDPAVDRKVRLVLARADALIAIGEAMRTEMIAAGAGPEKISVLRTGYHLVEPPAGSGEPPRPPGYLLAVGRLIPKKGFDLLLAAMRRVVDRHPGQRLVVAGEGPLLDPLRQQARRLGLARQVEFAGFVAGDGLTALYRAARLFVCPSRREPLGLVNLEAMACGLPVAAFRVDGIPEIVLEGESGLLARPEDADDLARAITRLLDDPILRDRLSFGAVRAACGYTWDKVAARHEELYDRIGTRGPRRLAHERPIRAGAARG